MGEFVALQVAVMTVSDTRSLEDDHSGSLLVAGLEAAGHSIAERRILRDDRLAVSDQLRRWVDDARIQVIVATGGTGITVRDVTPEALAPLVTKPLPGFGELFRMLSYEQIGAATIQSRAEAALCGSTLVFLLPGSTGAVQLGLEKILVPQLDSRTRPCNFVGMMPRFAPAD